MAIAPATAEDYRASLKKAVQDNRDAYKEREGKTQMATDQLLEETVRVIREKATEFPPEEAAIHEPVVEDEIKSFHQIALSMAEFTRQRLIAIHQTDLEKPFDPCRFIRYIQGCFIHRPSFSMTRKYNSNFTHERIILTWKDFIHHPDYQEWCLPGLSWGDSPRGLVHPRPGIEESMIPELTTEEEEDLLTYFGQTMIHDHNVVLLITAHDWFIMLCKFPDREVSLKCFVSIDVTGPLQEDTENVYFEMYHFQQYSPEQLPIDPRVLEMWAEMDAEKEETERGKMSMEEGTEESKTGVDDERNHAGAGVDHPDLEPSESGVGGDSEQLVPSKK